MLRFVNYDIVFREVPGEVTLAINLSGCPHRCKGCHSPHLREDIGEVLDEDAISHLLEKYCSAITCVCFMGGDADYEKVADSAAFIRIKTDGRIKTGWYSGNNSLPERLSLRHFNYIKVGAYVERLGGLDVPTTNQRFYRIENGKMTDVTSSFQLNQLLR